MTFDPQSYGPSEFLMAIKPEAVIGTGLVTTMQRVNIDVPLSFPELNTVVDFPVKSGVGRTAKTVDKFVCETGTLRSIPFTATADTIVLPLLIQNILTNTISGAIYNAAFQYLPPLLEHGAASDVTKTFTVAAPISPEGSNTVIFPGCVLQDLEIVIGSLEDRNGQAKINGNFVTQYKPTFAQAIPSSMAVYGNTYYYLDDFTTTRTFAGKSNVTIDGLTITINNISKYEGFQGANGDPESISRAVGSPGELSVMAAAILKYDSNTADLLENYKDGGIAAACELSNNASFASASGLGLKIAAGSINEQPALNDKGSAYIDVSVKALDNESDPLAQIIV